MPCAKCGAILSECACCMQCGNPPEECTCFPKLLFRIGSLWWVVNEDPDQDWQIILWKIQEQFKTHPNIIIKLTPGSTDRKLRVAVKNALRWNEALYKALGVSIWDRFSQEGGIERLFVGKVMGHSNAELARIANKWIEEGIERYLKKQEDEESESGAEESESGVEESENGVEESESGVERIKKMTITQFIGFLARKDKDLDDLKGAQQALRAFRGSGPQRDEKLYEEFRETIIAMSNGEKPTPLIKTEHIKNLFRKRKGKPWPDRRLGKIHRDLDYWYGEHFDDVERWAPIEGPVEDMGEEEIGEEVIEEEEEEED